MTDVRLTATNPDDSSVVPVACNAKGELKLEEPTINSDDYVAKAGDNMTGALTIGPDGGPALTTLAANGSAEFADNVNVKQAIVLGDFGAAGFAGGIYDRGNANDAYSAYLPSDQTTPTIALKRDGSAEFAGSIKASGATAEYTYARVYAGTDDISPQFQVIIDSGFPYPRQPVFNVERLGTGSTAGIYTDGSAEFADNVATDNRFHAKSGTFNINDIYLGKVLEAGTWDAASIDTNGKLLWGLGSDGSAEFSGDVVIGSRNRKWMIVESGGIAHLVEQTSTAGVQPAKYPALRNIPHELDLVEQALSEVMEKLRMNPPAGWPVWDGSDED